MKLSDSDLELLKQHPGGIYCIALKDDVWQAKLEEADDPDESYAYPLVYIGLSVKIKRRINAHFACLRKGTHKNKHLQHVFDKYGEDVLDAWIIETCNDDELNDREAFWIRLFASDDVYGFNMTEGGEGIRGYNISDTHRVNISIANKRAYSCKEIRRKLSLAQKERWENQEYRDRMSGDNNPMKRQEIREKFKGENNPMKRLDARAKLSAATKRRYENPEERAKLSASAKRRYENPEERARLSGDRSPTKRPEVREKISAALRGRKVSDETRAKQSANSASKRPEVREKIRIAHIGMKQSPETIAKRKATIKLNRMMKEARAAFAANNAECS